MRPIKILVLTLLALDTLSGVQGDAGTSTCTASGGDDLLAFDGPCIFPFKENWDGPLLRECAIRNENGRPWCATQIWPILKTYMTWGYCHDNCSAMCSIEQDYQYMGQRLNNVQDDTFQYDAKSCRSFCKSTYQTATHFNWFSSCKNDVQHHNRCWCMSSITGTKYNPGVFSGEVCSGKMFRIYFYNAQSWT